jgi:hypothetical protein
MGVVRVCGAGFVSKYNNNSTHDFAVGILWFLRIVFSIVEISLGALTALGYLQWLYISRSGSVVVLWQVAMVQCQSFALFSPVNCCAP